MTTQELFDQAVQQYNDIIAVINRMSQLVVDHVNKDFDARIARAKFDVLLQYTLLRVAIADGKLLPVEGEFIDKITDTCDVLRLVPDFPKDANWTWIAKNVGFDDLLTLVAIVEEVAKEHMSHFADMFAIIDKADTEHDCLNEIAPRVCVIASLFILIDGERDEKEVHTTAEVVYKYLVGPWQDMIQHA